MYEKSLYFLLDFAVNLKLLISPLPPPVPVFMASCTINILHQSGVFVTFDDSTKSFASVCTFPGVKAASKASLWIKQRE